MGIRDEDLKTMDFSDIATGERLPAVTPGDVLQDYLDGAGVTASRLAQATHMPQTRVSNILKGRRAIGRETKDAARTTAAPSRLLREAGFVDIRFERVGRVPALAKSMIAAARKVQP